MMKTPIRNPNHKPTHPGEVLREDVLPELGLSISAFAEAMGVSRQSLHKVVTEKAAVSPEMALRLGKLLGNGPQLWVRMQEAVDLWQAERKLAEEIAHIRPLVA